MRSTEQLCSVAEASAEAEAERFRQVIEAGLDGGSPARSVVIAGAGMSGLLAGALLKSGGHRVQILEANKRVGGRIRTLREPFSEGLIAEAGAMRIPTFHTLTRTLVDRLALRTADFYNADAVPGRPAEHRRNGYLHFNGVRVRLNEYEANPRCLRFPDLEPQEEGRTGLQLLDEAVRPIREFLLADPERNWPRFVQGYGHHSVRDFLKTYTLYSEAAIELIGLVSNLESRMMTSFQQSFRELLNLDRSNAYYRIEDGNDRLPAALCEQFDLEDDIHFGARLARIENPPGGPVTAHTGDGQAFRGDRMIVTIPFSSLRFVRVDEPFSVGKRRAVRSLHYGSSTKVFLEFRRRFWEQDDDIFGGGSITDLPSRFIYYPSQDLGSDGHGIVLASYTWSEDSQKWEAMKEELRIQFALNDLAEVHGQHIREAFVRGKSYSWNQNEFSCGAFAIFAPGQQTLLHDDTLRSEGHVHFAGEHTTLKHAWIEGAVESAVRAALEVAGS